MCKLAEYHILLEPMSRGMVAESLVQGSPHEGTLGIVWSWEIRQPQAGGGLGPALAFGYDYEESGALDLAKLWADALSRKKTIVYEPPSSP